MLTFFFVFVLVCVRLKKHVRVSVDVYYVYDCAYSHTVSNLHHNRHNFKSKAISPWLAMPYMQRSSNIPPLTVTQPSPCVKWRMTPYSGPIVNTTFTLHIV